QRPLRHTGCRARSRRVSSDCHCTRRYFGDEASPRRWQQLRPDIAHSSCPAQSGASMSLRVLVVEDDREIRKLLESSLGVEGFLVRTAVSVSEASAILHNWLPDIVLLDLGLPDGDGADLVRTIRRQHALPILVI